MKLFVLILPYFGPTGSFILLAEMFGRCLWKAPGLQLCRIR